MRILIIFLFVGSGLIAASNVNGQNAVVTLHMKNQSVSEVLDKIENQSDYYFFYNNKEVDVDRNVSVTVNNKQIKEVLDILFSGTDIQYSVLDKSIILSNKKIVSPELTQQEPATIRGIITDDLGEPLVGVSIALKGTSTGTISDLNGTFSLSAPKGSRITFTYIGYIPQEIIVGDKTFLQIKLNEDQNVLDEVVVVGFGVQKKVNLTGAVGTVSSQMFEDRPVTTAAQALQGAAPGLFISQSAGNKDSNTEINIRGIGTIGTGSKGTPLILIDGMEGDINTINPQDIENISVLKDAAASSIYGSRAPFGVILVTTKKGEKGRTIINYNNSFRWNSPVLLPNMMDSYTFALNINDANINSGASPLFSEEHIQRILDYQSGKLKESVPVNPNNSQMWMDGYYGGNDNIDYYDVIFRKQAFSQEHNFSISGAGDKIGYYASIDYLDQNGLMKINQDTYDRYTSTLKLNVQLTDWAQINLISRYIRDDFEKPSNMGDGLYQNLGRQAWPTLPLYDPNGYLFCAPSTPLGLRDGGRHGEQSDNLYQQGQLVLEPVKNWKIFGEFNFRLRNTTTHADYQKTYNHDVNGNPYVWNTNDYIEDSALKDDFINTNVYTDYTYNLKSGHTFKGMIGMQTEVYNNRKISLSRNGIIVPSLTEIDVTSGIDHWGNTIAPGVSGYSQDWATAGFFGRINYDYKQRYLLEANLRYDGTSRFRKDERWNYFPSVSVGWNIANENFWSSLEKYVGHLKLRGSYGELGNQNTENIYPTYQTMYVGIASGDWLINGIKPNYTVAPQLISSNLTWERVRTWNAGIDFGAFNNRLIGSFDVFNRFTYDMVGPAPELPLTLGIDVPRTNNTDLKTSGFELTIGWSDRLKNGLGYSAKFLLADAQTEITRYPNETNSLENGMYRKGQNVGEIWGYTTKGIARTQEEMDDHMATLPHGGQDALGNTWEAGDIMFVDKNNDGKIDNGANTLGDHGDLSIIGNTTPRFQFGFDLGADYKGFDFRAFFQGVMKRDYFQDSYFFWGVNSDIWSSIGTTAHTDYFRADASHPMGQNLNSYFPRPLFGTSKNLQTQTKYLQDASYIRLKNIQLGYTLPASLTNKFAVEKLRFYVSGENLWTATKMFEMFDPETVGGGWNYSGSVYPLSKTIAFGLSLNF